MTSLFLVPTQDALALDISPLSVRRSRRQQKSLYHRSLVMSAVLLVQTAVALTIYHWSSGPERMETPPPLMVKTVTEERPVEQIAPPQPMMVDIPPPKITPPPLVQIAETQPVHNNHITLPTPPVAPPAPAVEQVTADVSAAELTYHQKLLLRLGKFKTYPRAAKLAKTEGIVEVSFTINQNGEVLASSVIASSGSPVLDASALETLRKASPFPPIPPELGKTQMTLTVPIEYSVQSSK